MSDAGGPTPIRIEPRVRSRQQLAEAPAKLVATLLSVATAGLLDAGRFRRGREYASSGAVTRLVVSPRTLHGSVLGSRREPYEVEIHTDLVAPPAGGAMNPAALMSITPDADELHAMCSCPDAADSVCKHAAAVMLAFAEEAADRPALLIAWRCGDTPATQRATIGSRRWGIIDDIAERRAGAARRDARRPGRPVPPPSPFATRAWLEFVAFADELPDTDVLAAAVVEARSPGDAGDPLPAEPLPLGSERVGGVDLSALVHSAQQAMRAAGHDIV
jgi:hypothetical protein